MMGHDGMIDVLPIFNGGWKDALIEVELLFGQGDSFPRFAEYGEIFLVRSFCLILSSREDTVAVVLLFAAVANEGSF